MSLALPLDLYSPDQVGIIMLELNAYLGKLRDMSVRAKVDKTPINEALPHFSALLTSLLQANTIRPTDMASLERLLGDLETLRKTAPVARITLTSLPNRTIKHQFITWFRQQIRPDSLLTFSVRSDLGGGVVVQTNSHVFNYSFRQKILDNKSRIAEIAQSV